MGSGGAHASASAPSSPDTYTLLFLIFAVLGALVLFVQNRRLRRDLLERRHIEKGLARAKGEAEQLSDMKSAFMANISHEIRTPMNGIMGFVNLLNKTTLDDTQQRYLNTVNTSVNELLTIINEILDFSRLETGKVKLNIAPFHLLDIITDDISQFRPLARDKGLNLHLKIAGTVPERVLGDGPRIHQIFTNLLSNAIRYTDTGEVNVTIKGRALPEENITLVTLVVKDSGRGMEDDKLQHIFEPFSQLDTHYHRESGGIGLGLSICKHLVDAMSGSIRVHSQPRSGSTFEVDLPLERGDAHQGISEPQPLAMLVGKRVLVVDDNNINRLLITTLLKAKNLRVDEAIDGLDAVEMTRRQAYDLIFMDIRMPKMDGMEATRCIRAAGPNKQTTVIALTAHALANEIDAFLAAGLDECLIKPIAEDELEQILLRELV